MVVFKPSSAFDLRGYLKAQTEAIAGRMGHAKGTLVLEIGGKLFEDYHAAKVLPGYDTDTKMKILRALSKEFDVEVIMALNERSLKNHEILGTLGIGYGRFALEMARRIKKEGLRLEKVVFTFHEGRPPKGFEGYEHYFLNYIPNYPKNLEAIFSRQGFGRRPYLKSDADVVVIVAPGPNSGKMATAMMLLYQHRREKWSYAKLETFPVWNLPPDNEINLAYEAATADIGDYTMIDPYHLRAYGIKATNYNRDVRSFKLLRRLLKYSALKYKSPTDMGVNKVGFFIRAMDEARAAARREIIRRWFRYKALWRRLALDKQPMERVGKIMERAGIKFSELPAVGHRAALWPPLERADSLDQLLLNLAPKAKVLYKGFLKHAGRRPRIYELLPMLIAAGFAPRRLWSKDLFVRQELTPEEERYLLELGVFASWDL